MIVHSRLLSLMHEASLRYFEHEWADGLEFFLWREINGLTLPRSQQTLKPFEMAEIDRASRVEGCWYMYDDKGNFKRVTLKRWRDIYTSEFGAMT